jgi:predicted nucleic acid-binding protein
MRFVRPAWFGALLLFGVSLFAAEVEVPTAPAYQPSREELLQTVRHIGDLSKGLQDDLNNEKASELQISKSLSGASDALVTATAQNKTLQTKIDRIALHAGALEIQVEKDKAKLLRRDIIIAALALTIGVYAFLKFYLRIPFL